MIVASSFPTQSRQEKVGKSEINSKIIKNKKIGEDLQQHQVLHTHIRFLPKNVLSSVRVSLN